MKSILIILLNLIGGIKGNIHRFDFRLPSDKRKEFNKIRNTIYKILLDKHGNVCQLNFHPDCEQNGFPSRQLIVYILDTTIQPIS